MLYTFPRADEARDPRLGVSVGRRVGGAVERNRVKRMLREAFWALDGRLGRNFGGAPTRVEATRKKSKAAAPG